ncbi:MAG TPA: hypothetical protein PLU73_10145 [Bacteroidia bacterium]|jgi:uncharacterized membrane protein|nr:hypothetical protein [Bacteroidia bacterium]
MATTIHSTGTHNTGSKAHASSYERFMEKIKFSYFGIISMTILIGSCLGGITAMVVLKNDAALWQLGLCMAVSMANNVAAISQAPIKWVVNSFVIGIVVNTLLILANVL